MESVQIVKQKLRIMSDVLTAEPNSKTNLQSLNGDKGIRYNQGKIRYDLLPPHAIEQLAKILTMGANKYADRNWEKGMNWTSTVASLKRHLAAFEKGEDKDPESGLLHMAHIMCNAAFITEYYKIYPQGDDRPHRYLNEPKIGLDIDEVLCNWVGGWTSKWNLDVPRSWFFDRDIMERFERMREEGTLEDFYMNLKPLLDPNDIPFEPHCYITSRPVDVKVSEAWLDMWGFPTVPVYCVGSRSSKVEIALKSGIDIFVDDNYRNFKQLNKAGICCYLYDTPHNDRYDVGHKRIKSLNDLKY